jgi:hypothetical protein
MERVGDEQAGFSFSSDPSRDTFEVRAWGFWNVDVAAAFGTNVLAALRTRARWKRLVLDMSDLKPMREEGQRAFATLLRSLPSAGVAGTSVVTTSHLTKLQLARIAMESAKGTDIEWVTAKVDVSRDG